jgi:DinB superfamily
MSLEPVREKLARAQTVFFRAADMVSVDNWGCSPDSEQWSAAELVAHLVTVERSILTQADRVTRKTPIPFPFHKRVHLPIWLVQSRIIRRKSPVTHDPALICEKETMLAELRSARERTLSFLAETERRDLSTYLWKHPFLGMLNTYEWIEMVAAHQIRHAKQMREIAESVSRKL